MSLTTVGKALSDDVALSNLVTGTNSTITPLAGTEQIQVFSGSLKQAAITDVAAYTTTIYQGFKASSSTVSRTIQSKLADIVSVKDFGAVGDGVTDDTVAIQAAISSVSTLGRGRVYLPAGTYLTTSTINRLPGVYLFGDGDPFTTIKASGNYPVISSIGSITNILNQGGVSNMLIRGGYSTTNGFTNAHGIYEAWTNRTVFENVRFHGCNYAMYASNVWQNKWDNLQADGGGTDANNIGFYMDAVDPANQNNAVQAVNCMAQSCISYGFRLINFNGSKFTNCEASGNPMINAWYLGDPPSGNQAVRWGHFVNCLADSTTSHGWHLELGAAASFQQVQFTNCWSGSASNGSGWYIAGVSQCIFANLLVIASGKNAMQFVNSTRCIVTCGMLQGYDVLAQSNPGILLNNSQYISIDDKTQLYTTSSSAPNIVETNGSDFNGSAVLTSTVTLTGAHSRFRWVGVMEKSGSTTIATGATIATVTHGLPYTPNPNDIRITARDGGAGAGWYSVQNVTATTFQIVANTAPTSTTTISWSIIPLS